MGHVIVTGAAGGIGQALVRAFSESGHPVIGVDLTAKPAGLPIAHYIECDLACTVAEPAYANEVFSTIRTALGKQPLDALINNAAVQILGKVEDLDRDAWHRTLDVNLLAPFLWAQAFLPELEEAKGCVLNMSSIHARLTKSKFVAYATSKAALSGMTRAMAIELGSRVRVNAIEPAAIDTPMLQAGFSGNPAGYELLKYCHPSRCVGSTDGLARLVVAITQLEDGFANGSIVRFDGGIGAQLHDPRTLDVSCEDSG